MADLSELTLPVKNSSTGEVTVQNFKLKDYYGGGGANDNFKGTLAEWNALSLAQKAQYTTLDITEEISPDLGIALQQTVTLSASTDTTVTFTDPRINALSEIQVFAGRSTGDVQGSKNRFPCSDVFTSVSNGTGSCVITFPKEASEVSVIVRIYVR